MSSITQHSVEFSLSLPTNVTIRRELHSDRREQGILLHHRRAMRVGDISAKELVLWSTTAPMAVTVCVPAGSLIVWNVWRDNGAMHGLLGNAEIRTIELPNGGVLLECCDGHAPSASTDLRVELSFDSALAQEA